MSKAVQSLHIKVDEWPRRSDLSDLLTAPNPKEAIEEFITQEFDTDISFKVGEVDLLSGYPEAFILPLSAFLGSLSQGIQKIRSEKQAKIPIYLQQYEIGPSSSSHSIELSLDDDIITMCFEWGGDQKCPKHLASLGEIYLKSDQFEEVIESLLANYNRKLVMLLNSISARGSEEFSSLFHKS